MKIHGNGKQVEFVFSSGNRFGTTGSMPSINYHHRNLHTVALEHGISLGVSDDGFPRDKERVVSLKLSLYGHYIEILRGFLPLALSSEPRVDVSIGGLGDFQVVFGDEESYECQFYAMKLVKSSYAKYANLIFFDSIEQPLCILKMYKSESVLACMMLKELGE